MENKDVIMPNSDCTYTLFEVVDDAGTRLIKYIGYGYYCEDEDKPCRMVWYRDFCSTEYDVLNRGFYNTEAGLSENYKQHIQDCYEEEMFREFSGIEPCLEKDIRTAEIGKVYYLVA